jgi:hypothetical protein
MLVVSGYRVTTSSNSVTLVWRREYIGFKSRRLEPADYSYTFTNFRTFSTCVFENTLTKYEPGFK